MLSKKHPPYVRENNDNCDSISVFVWSNKMRSLPWTYNEYVFVKRDNGTYRMKYKLFDWFYLVFPTILTSYALFILYCFREEFVKHPEAIPALVSFVLWLFFMLAFANYPKLEARICFRKHIDN